MQRIIVFGTGKFFQNAEYELRRKYEIVCFVDNKVSVGEKAYYKDTRETIYNPGEIHMLEVCPVLIMTRDFIDNCVQLIRLGVAEERMVFGVALFPGSIRERMVFTDGDQLKVEGGEIVFRPAGKKKYIITSMENYDKTLENYVREKGSEDNPYIALISHMPLNPAGRLFGCERGKPVDRYYIEKFLESNKEDIRGDVLEIAETTYSVKYGEDRIRNAFALHVEGWGGNVIKGNLETGDGIEENCYDAVIITQTLMFIYNIQNVAKNIYKMLKKGGTALVTVSGISQISRYDAENWGSYYSFHEDALKRLFEPLFGKENVKTRVFGNVKTAISLLYGLCCEDLEESDFYKVDEDYPVIIGAVLHK